MQMSSQTLHQKTGLAGILLHVTHLHVYIDSKRISQGKWHLGAQVCFATDRNAEMVLLISVLDNLHHKHSGLTLQCRHCEFLAWCADRVRKTTMPITVGPQQHNNSHRMTRNIQQAPSADHLPDSLWSCFGYQPCSETLRLDMHINSAALPMLMVLLFSNIHYFLLWV